MADLNAVANLWKQTLGRTPTPQELAYIGKFLDEGGIGEYEASLIAQQLPEFQSKLMEQNTDRLGARLAASDQDILGRAAAASNSQFASLGRPVTSAQSAQVASAGAQLAQNRQALLADFYGKNLSHLQNSYAAQGQGALERAYGLRDETRQRKYQIEDRNYMNDMYQNYLNQQRRNQRAGALGSIAGIGLGAGLGAALAPTGMGLAGARLGAQLGGDVGYNAGGLFRP